MSDDLVRLEYKIDLILHALMDKGLMIPEPPNISGIESDVCPVCGHEIHLKADFKNERLRYCCGCELPKTIVPGISGLLESEDKSDGDSRDPTDEVLQQTTHGGGDS